MPLCCMGHHHSLEPWYKEKASHQNVALYLYKSRSAEDPSRPRCAQCVSIPTTAMHLGGVNQMHRLAWEATLSPVLFPVSVHQAKQCSATSCLQLRFQVFLSQGLVPAHPPSLPISAATGKLLRSCSEISWHKGRHMFTMRQHSTISEMREQWILCREEFVTAQCSLMLWQEKGDFNPSSAWIQLEKNNVDTAREKSGQLLKQFNNEHLVNDYEDVITNLCQKWGPSALQSLPMFLQTGPGWWLK